jgi:hypothetical protein
MYLRILDLGSEANLICEVNSRWITPPANLMRINVMQFLDSVNIWEFGFFIRDCKEHPIGTMSWSKSVFFKVNKWSV